MKISIKQLSTISDSFTSQLDGLLAWDSVSDVDVQPVVANIITDIRKRGDEALIEYTNKFDRRNIANASQLEVSHEEMRAASVRITSELLAALESSAKRVRSYHEHQQQDSWQYQEPDGTILGQQIQPLDRVGVYVPGGKAAYPSSV